MSTRSPSSKTLTVRLPEDLYAAAQATAKQRDISLNALLQTSLAEALRTSAELARYEEYTALGEDSDSCDIEYAIHAQAEVMLGAEPT